jgi:4'-phosphopantetheinyl transferase
MSGGGAVGVDVESLDGFRFETVEEVLLHPGETATTAEELATTWVRKEALLKAGGYGLSVDPRTIRLGPADASPAVLLWTGVEPVWVQDLQLAPDLRAALAGQGGQPDQVRVRQVEPGGLRG